MIQTSPCDATRNGIHFSGPRRPPPIPETFAQYYYRPPLDAFGRLIHCVEVVRASAADIPSWRLLGPDGSDLHDVVLTGPSCPTYEQVRDTLHTRHGDNDFSHQTARERHD